MQFKKVGNRINIVVYTGYNREKKRANLKMLGSLNALTFAPSDGLIDALTVDQRKELQSYIDENLQERENSTLLYRAKYLHSDIKKLADSIKKESTTVDKETALQWYESLDAMAKALKSVGHPRPKKAPPAILDPRQSSLEM